MGCCTIGMPIGGPTHSSTSMRGSWSHAPFLRVSELFRIHLHRVLHSYVPSITVAVAQHRAMYPDSKGQTQMSQDTLNPTTTTETQKVSVADRKALAAAAFVPGSDVATIAALFGNVPNPREFVDATYGGLVSAIALASATDDTIDVAAMLAPLATLRGDVLTALDAMVPQKSVRIIDPAEVRAALVARIGVLDATLDHLVSATQWVRDLLTAVDDGTVTDSERVAAFVLPDGIAKATDRIARVLSTEKRSVSTDGTRERNTVDHTAHAPTVGAVLNGKGAHASRTFTVTSVTTSDDGKVTVKGTTDDSSDVVTMNAAATRYAGGARNGWDFFGLV